MQLTHSLFIRIINFLKLKHIFLFVNIKIFEIYPINFYNTFCLYKIKMCN